MRMTHNRSTCLSCRIGTLQQKTAPYAAWHADEFVVLPAAPIWVCDVCGERTYDQLALEYLLTLAGPVASDSVTGKSGTQRGVDVPPAPESDRTRRRV
jgi:YgiT-type zinc finger domain-containing protein